MLNNMFCGTIRAMDKENNPNTTVQYDSFGGSSSTKFHDYVRDYFVSSLNRSLENKGFKKWDVVSDINDVSCRNDYYSFFVRMCNNNLFKMLLRRSDLNAMIVDDNFFISGDYRDSKKAESLRSIKNNITKCCVYASNFIGGFAREFLKMANNVGTEFIISIPANLTEYKNSFDVIIPNVYRADNGNFVKVFHSDDSYTMVNAKQYVLSISTSGDNGSFFTAVYGTDYNEKRDFSSEEGVDLKMFTPFINNRIVSHVGNREKSEKSITDNTGIILEVHNSARGDLLPFLLKNIKVSKMHIKASCYFILPQLLASIGQMNKMIFRLYDSAVAGSYNIFSKDIIATIGNLYISLLPYVSNGKCDPFEVSKLLNKYSVRESPAAMYIDPLIDEICSVMINKQLLCANADYFMRSIRKKNFSGIISAKHFVDIIVNASFVYSKYFEFLGTLCFKNKNNTLIFKYSDNYNIDKKDIFKFIDYFIKNDSKALISGSLSSKDPMDMKVYYYNGNIILEGINCVFQRRSTVKEDSKNSEKYQFLCLMSPSSVLNRECMYPVFIKGNVEEMVTNNLLQMKESNNDDLVRCAVIKTENISCSINNDLLDKISKVLSYRIGEKDGNLVFYTHIPQDSIETFIKNIQEIKDNDLYLNLPKIMKALCGDCGDKFDSTSIVPLGLWDMLQSLQSIGVHVNHYRELNNKHDVILEPQDIEDLLNMDYMSPLSVTKYDSDSRKHNSFIGVSNIVLLDSAIKSIQDRYNVMQTVNNMGGRSEFLSAIDQTYNNAIHYQMELKKAIEQNSSNGDSMKLNEFKELIVKLENMKKDITNGSINILNAQQDYKELVDVLKEIEQKKIEQKKSSL